MTNKMTTQDQRYTSVAVDAAKTEYIRLNQQLKDFADHYQRVWHDCKFGTPGTRLTAKKSDFEIQEDIRHIRAQMSRLLARLGTMADVYEDL
jgi:hypothetical protein